MKPYKIGYTQGVFDLFHVGHLNLLKKAKEQCDFLIVGVNSDELVKTYKHKTPVIPGDQRRQIVEALKVVDQCILVDTLDKEIIWKEHPFDAVFIGDDWKGSERWTKTEETMKRYDVDVIYLPRTKEICSTDLAKKQKEHGIL